MPNWIKRVWCWFVDHRVVGCGYDGVAQVRCVRCGSKYVIAMNQEEYDRRVRDYGRDRVWEPR